MKLDGMTIGLALEAVEGRQATLARLDTPTVDELSVMGVRFIVSNEVPRDKLHIIARTASGGLATLIYSVPEVK